MSLLVSRPQRAPAPLPNASEQGRLMYRERATLRLHPAYEHVVGSGFGAGSAACNESLTASIRPVTTTRSGIVVDGHERWLAAERERQGSVLCLELELTDDEALEMIIERHGRSRHLNSFARVALALHLEPMFKAAVMERLRASQCSNPPSMLTERVHRDVRSEIARLAGVCTGNVTKVKQILADVIPEVLVALRQGTVSIHQAWQWRQLAKRKQRDAFWVHQHRLSIDHTIRVLLAQSERRSEGPQQNADLRDILGGLADPLHMDIPVFISDVPGAAVVITRELLERIKRGPVG